jgi:hypothetical protein
LRLGDAEGVGGRDEPGHDGVDGIRAGRREALLAALQCWGTPEGSDRTVPDIIAEAKSSFGDSPKPNLIA